MVDNTSTDGLMPEDVSTKSSHLVSRAHCETDFGSCELKANCYVLQNEDLNLKLILTCYNYIMSSENNK